ncbi:MAG TPA: hypothetical protein VFY71_07330 [Planctomycetota bacterium]|nr:hypothetical protein [Planctomycetota bacterium]
MDEGGAPLAGIAVQADSEIVVLARGRRTFGPQPVLLRFAALGEREGEIVDRDLRDESEWVLPTPLDLGDWRVQLFDRDGAVLSESRIHIAEPRAQHITLEL